MARCDVSQQITDCNVCIGRYKVRAQGTYDRRSRKSVQTQALLERGLQYCYCNNKLVPAAPFNPEFLENNFFPPLPPDPPSVVFNEPLVGPPFPITPPLPFVVPPCPDNPPVVPITNLQTFHIVNESDISDVDIDAQIIVMQRQINNSFAPYWGRACTLVRSSETPLGIGNNIFIRNGQGDIDACGYHIDKFFGLQVIGKVFADRCSWEDTLNHEVLEMLADPKPSADIKLGPLVTFMGKTGRFIIEVCDPVSDISYQSNKLSNFVYPAWFIEGSPCPWDRLGILPGAMTFTAGGFLSFRETAPDNKWWTIFGNPPIWGGG